MFFMEKMQKVDNSCVLTWYKLSKFGRWSISTDNIESQLYADKQMLLRVMEGMRELMTE